MSEVYDRIVGKLASSRVGTWIIMNLGTGLDRKLMRWSGGRWSTASGTTMHDNMVLLFVQGAKSGLERCVPLVAALNGDDIVLIASRGGNENNPNWYHNLKANPRCAIEHGGKRSNRIAREAGAEERELLWQLALEVYEGYGVYEQRTDRLIPLMILNPV